MQYFPACPLLFDAKVLIWLFEKPIASSLEDLLFFFVQNILIVVGV